MKCLSIKPEFASKIITRDKQVEFRSWPTNHRGWIAIHATRPTGAIVGLARIIACKPMGDGYAWLLSDARPLEPPIPLKGQVGLFNIDDKLIEVPS